MTRSGGGSARVSSARATLRLRRSPRARRRPAAARARQPLRGADDRLAPAVRQREAERHAAVRAGRLDERGERPAHERAAAGRGRRSSSARMPRVDQLGALLEHERGGGAASAPPTSAAGRSQFCAENAYSVSCRMPSSRAARTTRRTASAPCAVPVGARPPRAAAQRPLPSMMIATCSGRWVQRGLLPRKHPSGRARPARDPAERSRRERRTVARRGDRPNARTRMMRRRPRLAACARPPSPPEPSIIRSTLRALLHPRRLVPIVLLSASLVVAQGNYSRDPLAIPLGIAMCVAFVIVAPVSWRVLFPDRVDLRHGGIRLILYATIGGGRGAGRSASSCRACSGMGRTLLTAPHQRRRLPGAVPRRRLGPRARHVAGEQLARAEARATSLAREAEGAQLLALRSHLDPHFLFNTLNAIAEWCREDGETAERAVHAAVGDAAHRAGRRARRRPGRSREELALLDTLFELHRLRDPDRVRVDAAPARAAARGRRAADAAAAAGRERGQARAGGRARRRRSC